MTEILSNEFMSELTRVNREIKKVTGSNLIDIDMMIKHARLKAGIDDCDTSLPALRDGVREVVVDIFKQQCTEIMFTDPDDSDDYPVVVTDSVLGRPIDIVGDGGDGGGRSSEACCEEGETEISPEEI